MSEVTITIVIKGAGDTVSTAVNGGSSVGGPTPDVIPGGVSAAPQPTRPTKIAGQASGPVPT
ncbi:MAG TPA: hypothetical protein VM450_05770, partial [Thermomicrobiales bacterium]|nr:hypothetical protein [Thermomicrobiales bacterium]